MAAFRTEAEMCETLSHYLLTDGWEVYQEVCMPHGGRADFVAIKGPIRWIIEAKMSAGMDVIRQSMQHLGFAHMISIATPPCRGGFRGNAQVVRHCLASFTPRIGWLIAQEKHDTALRRVQSRTELGERIGRPYTPTDLDSPVVERVKPGFNRRANVKRWHVVEQQKDFAAAGTSGTYWTPFKQTCSNLIEYIQHEGHPVLLKDALKVIDHHYATETSARCTLSRLLQAGVVPELVAYKEKNRVYVAERGAEECTPSHFGA